jgi:hypothetical protein
MCRWVVNLYGCRKDCVQGGDYQAKHGIAKEDDSIGAEYREREAVLQKQREASS